MVPYLIAIPAFIVLAHLSAFVAKSPEFTGVKQLGAGSSSRACNYFDITAVAGMTLFLGLRFESGSDSVVYDASFRSMDPTMPLSVLIEQSPQEVGYVSLSYVLRHITDEPTALFLVFAFATVAPAYWALRRFSPDPAFSITLFLLIGPYLGAFNGMRQWAAVCILFAAYLSFRRTEKLRFFLPIALLATSLHTAAFLAAISMLAAHGLVSSSERRVRRFFAVLLVVAASVPLLAPILFSDAVLERYGAYTEGGASGVGSYLLFLFYAVLLLVSFLGTKRRLSRDYVLLACLALVSIALGTSHVSMGRMAAFYIPYFTVLLAEAFPRSKASVAWRIGIYVACFLVFIMTLLNFSHLIPYQVRALW